jgi:hypothetical protein
MCVVYTVNTTTPQGASASITECTLQSNTAIASGGALFVAGRSGSVSQTSTSVTQLSNSLLLHNTAVSGGAVACDVDANVALTSCSVGKNTAVTEVSVTLLHSSTDATEPHLNGCDAVLQTLRTDMLKCLVACDSMLTFADALSTAITALYCVIYRVVLYQ